MQLTIDALKQAATWPGTGQRTPVVLASRLMAAELYQEGLKYFAAHPDAAPAGVLRRALAGAFEFRLDGRTGEAIAKLDPATGPGLGLPHHFRGISPGRLPGCAGRAETVLADLEFVLAANGPVPAWLVEGRIGGLDSVRGRSPPPASACPRPRS
jgi:hypothetical protein